MVGCSCAVGFRSLNPPVANAFDSRSHRSAKAFAGSVIWQIRFLASHLPAYPCYTADMEEADILRSAHQLIKSYGAKAAEIAAGKVVAMQQMGDDEGMAAWLDIMLAVRTLQQESDEGPATAPTPQRRK